MKNTGLVSLHARRVGAVLTIIVAGLTIFSQIATAASWNNIEPLKSRRADVERILGKPIEDKIGTEGTLHFNVAGGMVTVAFVTARFVANKKLDQNLEGTVLQIVLQHEHSSDTPESMGLTKNSDFTRENVPNGMIYRNLKDGIVYTFIGGQLKTTRYAPAAGQLARARKGK